MYKELLSKIGIKPDVIEALGKTYDEGAEDKPNLDQIASDFNTKKLGLYLESDEVKTLLAEQKEKINNDAFGSVMGSLITKAKKFGVDSDLLKDKKNAEEILALVAEANSKGKSKDLQELEAKLMEANTLSETTRTEMETALSQKETEHKAQLNNLHVGYEMMKEISKVDDLLVDPVTVKMVLDTKFSNKYQTTFSDSGVQVSTLKGGKVMNDNQTEELTFSQLVKKEIAENNLLKQNGGTPDTKPVAGAPIPIVHNGEIQTEAAKAIANNPRLTPQA